MTSIASRDNGEGMSKCPIKPSYDRLPDSEAERVMDALEKLKTRSP